MWSIIKLNGQHITPGREFTCAWSQANRNKARPPLLDILWPWRVVPTTIKVLSLSTRSCHILLSLWLVSFVLPLKTVHVLPFYVWDRRIVLHQNLRKSKYNSPCVAEDSPVQHCVQAAALSPHLLVRIYKWLWLREVFTSSQNTRSHTYVHFRA